MKHSSLRSENGRTGTITIVDHVSAAAQRHPQKVALISANTDRHVSYSELMARARSFSQNVSSLPAGSRVAVLLDNKIETIVALLGCHLANQVFVPIDSRTLVQILPLMNTLQPAAVVFARDQIECDVLAGLQASMPDCLSVDVAQCAHLQETRAKPSRPPALSDTAIMLFTSGTTSARKAVSLSHRAFAAPHYSISPLMGYSGEEVEYVCGNLDHAFAIGRMRNILAAGATMVFDEGAFMPQKAFKALAQTEVNVLSSPAPGIILMLKKHKADLAGLTDQLKIIKMASQGVALIDKKELLEMFPKTKVFLNYGLSEAQRTTLLAMHQEPEHLGSSGRPVAEHEVVIRDPVTREILPYGHEGLISIRGPNVMDEYWHNSEKTSDAFFDGWLVTDDVGELDREGFLTVHGRFDETIVSGGEKRSPEEFEVVLRAFLSDTSFTVCAMKDPQGILGDVPVLCVERTETDTIQKWQEWPAQRVRILKAKAGKVPKYAMSVPRLPKTATGKMQRKKLTQTLNAWFAGQV